MILVQENRLMSRVGFVGDSQQRVIFWMGPRCLTVPAATNCLCFENVLEKKVLSGISLPNPQPKYEQQQREGFSSILFPPSQKHQTTDVTRATHNENTQRTQS